MSDIPPYFIDVSGVFNIQKNLIQPLPNDANPQSKAIVSGVSSNLNALYNSFIQAGVTNLGTIEHQNEMMRIVSTENDRLNRKKDDINSAMVGKQRALELNETYRLRYRQYMKMLMVVIITILLVFFVNYLGQTFPVFPPVLFELITVIIISVGIVIIYYMFLDLLSRNNVHYNKLNLTQPGTGGNTVTSGSGSGQDLMSGINWQMCIGSSCCNEGTTWDPIQGVCVADTHSGNSSTSGNTISGFTTITQSTDYNNKNKNNLVKPISPIEGEQYTFV